MIEINNIAKSATQAQKTRKKKKEVLILYLYLLNYLISFSITLRTFIWLWISMLKEAKKDIKYFLEDRIYNIIKCRGSQPFHTIIIVPSIIPSCIYRTLSSHHRYQQNSEWHPTLLKVLSIRFKVVSAKCPTARVSSFEICAADSLNTVLKSCS